MLWCYAAASAIGLLLGTRYRIPALVLATWLVLAAAFGVGLAIGLPPGRSIVSAVAAVLALQLGYGAGALLAFGMSKTGEQRPFHDLSRPEEPRRRQDRR